MQKTPSDVEANVFFLPQLTIQREIDRASKGIHPVPSGKNLSTINTNNIRRHLKENNES